MMHRLLRMGACCLALALPYHTWAQAPTAADSVALAAAVEAATQHYTKATQAESVLFSGPEYVDPTKPGAIGHQFFVSNEPQLGTVTYRNAYFQQVPLRYDIVLDRVVLTYPNQVANIMLVPEALTDFSIQDRRFIHVLGDSSASALLRTGFYELLQPGPVNLLARHVKYLQQTTDNQSLVFKFRQIDKLIARSGSTAVEVGRLKDLLALLPAHRTEVQRYARQQKLRFSAAQREASALKALRYYYTLP
ncbi:hypothetical protein [Hymenobacter sp. BT559]|jgi:hypothetical protein|uniref:hypothetical protein n=1 Tax=Hymenobacter sp. BT559 TaxID=2795729 RepID=UPI0018EAC3DF|nr:hypothetical protein [Hymenobacter sp. BT559]MBJ6143242.1 hypothetical protein [Hymenobacter sp. BT559]